MAELDSARSGPALFGYCLDILLYGALTVQVYLYYLAFPNDKRRTKAIVAFTYIIGSVQTIFALHDFYTLFCTPGGRDWLSRPGNDFELEPGNTMDLHKYGFMWITIPASGALVAGVSQLFYAHRIYTISKSIVTTCIVTILAILQLGSGLITAATTYSHKRTSENTTFSVISRAIDAGGWGALGAFCDLIIAACMADFLRRQIRRTFRSTQVTLTRLKRLLLETGISTAILALTYASLTMNSPTTSAFMIPGLALGKLYGNSILVLLNNRFTIPGERNAFHPEFEIPESYRRSTLEP